MAAVDRPYGPLMVGIAGEALAEDEAEMLCHPGIGGVILFTRNYRSRSQLRALCDAIHALRRPSLVIAVDHEGGRVQRFKEGFAALPAAAHYGMRYDIEREEGRRIAQAGGRVMAAELRAAGVDFSFAPALDIDHGKSRVIGDRAFHREAEAVSVLARAFLAGMSEAGMAGVGKHFPGHGSVSEDSHLELPVDRRALEDIRTSDLLPFERLIASGDLTGVMPAHIVFERMDESPAGFSRYWIDDILRKGLRFDGPVFSDDLDMGGAAGFGDHVARTAAALDAGCDMALICNDPAAAARVLDTLDPEAHPRRSARIARMQGSGGRSDFASLEKDHLYRAALDDLKSSIALEESLSL
ncbi:MAG: beta-N-acetylhexosaminidase [Ectothiorhodospiraceae bacterium AqS1]|nr:beta-N-acetylhexosaminidase [Ectothiorhodospiraceae bacterium AqS1]MBF2759669.1 beta-N-acetylhexosaminidase [Ectothiorhodospiraceae bacterium AqS1]